MGDRLWAQRESGVDRRLKLTGEPAIAAAVVHGEALPSNWRCWLTAPTRTSPRPKLKRPWPASERGLAWPASTSSGFPHSRWFVHQPFTAANGLLTANVELRRDTPF